MLVVDDEPTVLLFLKKAVESCGLSAITASSIAEAQVVIRANDFDCALVDKNLPDGDGLELLSLIRAEKPEADVIVITGYVNSQSAIAALRLGAVDYLSKPLDVDTLEHRLKQVIERRRMKEERSQLQAMLVHADRLSSLGTMAAGVVHELNNPLAFVTSNLSFLDEELAELMTIVPEPMAKRLSVCRDTARDAGTGAKRLGTIVKDLRVFSRKDEAEKEVVSLESCLDASASVAWPAVKGKARVEKRYAPTLPVLASALRLEQVFLNLIVNAAQAIGGGTNDGLITLTTSTSGADSVVEIADNGPGMTPEVQQRLFEPFFTTKPRGEGTGLGLSVCHGIISAAGGRIEVRSQVAAGAVFRLIFPAHHPTVKNP